MSKLKVALIGAGQIARVSHIPAYRTMDDVEIVGVSDTFVSSAEKLAKEFDIPFFTDNHLELLEKVKPDAVSVCVPNKFHYPIVMDALKSKVNVLCEKPPAINYSEAKEMADTARENGVILTYDFHFRHGKNVSLIKKKIENGEFGEIYYGRAKWLRRAGVPGWGNFINKDIQGGGPLIDIGAHMLDLACYLLDYPEISYVSAAMSNRIGTTASNGFFGGWDPAKYTVEDGLFGTVFFKNGCCLSIETSFALNMKEKDLRAVDLFGEKMGASLFPLELYTGEKGEYSNIEYPFREDGDLHIDAITNFARACMGKEEVLINAEQGAYVERIIDSLYQSANTNKPVVLE